MYYIYGKGKNDKRFQPMRRDGYRATSIQEDCMVFIDKASAQEFLNKILKNAAEGAEFEIRRK